MSDNKDLSKIKLMVKTRGGLRKEWEQYNEERNQRLSLIEEQSMVYAYALDDRIWSTGYYRYEKEMWWKLEFYMKDLLATKNKDLIFNFLERPYLISGFYAYDSNIFNKRDDTGNKALLIIKLSFVSIVYRQNNPPFCGKVWTSRICAFYSGFKP